MEGGRGKLQDRSTKASNFLNLYNAEQIIIHQKSFNELER